MFGRKKIAELERKLSTLLRIHTEDVESLVKTIRDMDQRLYSMNQVAPNWERMRPILADLMVDVERRMRTESDRIRDMLIPEIKKVYSDEAKALDEKRMLR